MPVAPVWNLHRESVGSEKSQFVASSWMEESVVVIAERERVRGREREMLCDSETKENTYMK